MSIYNELRHENPGRSRCPIFVKLSETFPGCPTMDQERDAEHSLSKLFRWPGRESVGDDCERNVANREAECYTNSICYHHE